jgi:LEA14-like dessication related protein
LNFDRAEAENPGRVSLYYTLREENQAAREAGAAEIRDWEFLLNGAELAPFLSRGEGGLFRLDFDLPEDGGDFDEYRSVLTVILAGGGLAAAADFPRIREPNFTITSIAVLKDDLVNTRFRVDLRVENPNVFPVTLSSFGYELYGGGRFWADGKKRDLLEVPARGSAEARLLLIMNFINMPRDLFDEVLRMGSVAYRFAGEVLVDTPVPLLPSFRMVFDRRGTATVLN